MTPTTPGSRLFKSGGDPGIRSNAGCKQRYPSRTETLTVIMAFRRRGGYGADRDGGRTAAARVRVLLPGRAYDVRPEQTYPAPSRSSSIDWTRRPVSSSKRQRTPCGSAVVPSQTTLSVSASSSASMDRCRAADTEYVMPAKWASPSRYRRTFT